MQISNVNFCMIWLWNIWYEHTLWDLMLFEPNWHLFNSFPKGWSKWQIQTPSHVKSSTSLRKKCVCVCWGGGGEGGCLISTCTLYYCLLVLLTSLLGTLGNQKPRLQGAFANHCYRIYSIKPCLTYLFFVLFGAGLIQGWGLFGGRAYSGHELLNSKWCGKFSPVMAIYFANLHWDQWNICILN